MQRGALPTLASLVALLLAAAPVPAEIYRWTDERGVPHYSEGIDSVPERYRPVAVPLELRNRPAPAAGERPVQEAPSARGGTTIRYTPGEPIMVDVRINGSASARLMLDTGADRTLISPRALAAAGVTLTRPVARAEMHGVTGSDRMDFVVVESLEVGEARVTRLPVAAYEMPLARGDGLLGRDFLDRFNVSLDAARGVLTLAPK